MKNSGFSRFDGLIIEGDEVIENDIKVSDLCVRGTAAFLKRVEANKVLLGGESTINGLLTGDTVRISGTCTCKSNVLAEKFVISGSMKVSGKFYGDFINCLGELTVYNKINCLLFSVKGDFHSTSKVKFERLNILGKVESEGILDGLEVSINSDKTSSAKIITADVVTAKRTNNDESDTFVLRCDTMDCDDANLEYCKIDKLSCDNGVIGKGCVINEIEYFGEIKVSPEASVKRLIKL